MLKILKTITRSQELWKHFCRFGSLSACFKRLKSKKMSLIFLSKNFLSHCRLIEILLIYWQSSTRNKQKKFESPKMLWKRFNSYACEQSLKGSQLNINLLLNKITKFSCISILCIRDWDICTANFVRRKSYHGYIPYTCFILLFAFLGLCVQAKLKEALTWKYKVLFLEFFIVYFYVCVCSFMVMHVSNMFKSANNMDHFVDSFWKKILFHTLHTFSVNLWPKFGKVPSFHIFFINYVSM